MSVAYLALGAIGYWSQGRSVQEIIIFGTGFDVWSRVAAGAILFQVGLVRHRPPEGISCSASADAADGMAACK